MFGKIFGERTALAPEFKNGFQFSADPDYAWSILSVKQTVQPVIMSSYTKLPPDGHMRIVCISDTHNRQLKDLKIPDGDILIHSGDFSDTGTESNVEQFKQFLLALPHKHKIVIAGNHDLSFDKETYPSTWKRFGHSRQFDSDALKATLSSVCTYLEDTSVEINGVKIYGSPWQPTFCDWAFNIERGPPIAAKWDAIPTGVDILITHGPPIGHGDLCSGGNRAGCVDLLRVIQSRVKPKFHIFGHVHEGYGSTTDGTTVFINASTCTFKYKPTNPPVVFDIPCKPHLGVDGAP